MSLWTKEQFEQYQKTGIPPAVSMTAEQIDEEFSDLFLAEADEVPGAETIDVSSSIFVAELLVPSLTPQLVDPVPNFPAELKTLNNWGIWKQEQITDSKTGELKVNETGNPVMGKVPFNPLTGQRGNPSHEGSPTTFALSCEALKMNPSFGGLAFGFFYRDGYTGIDIDNCCNPETSVIEPWSMEIVKEINSYTEISTSGTGLHIVSKGWQVPIEGGREGRRKGIEIYSGKHYFTVSGNHLEGTPRTVEIRDLSNLFARMQSGYYQKLIQGASEKSTPSTFGELVSSGKTITSKRALLMTGTIESQKPFRIVDAFGNALEYESQSEADQALCNLIVMEVSKDPAIIDAEFRKSSLFRDKWERQDYRTNTVNRAIQCCTSTNASTGVLSPESDEFNIEGFEETFQTRLNMTPEEYAYQKEQEYPVFRLIEQPGPHFDEGILYGPLGQATKLIARYNESHPMAIYLNLIISIGNLFGRHSYFNVGKTQHFTNEYVAFVGESSVSRKGTGADEVDDLLCKVDERWFDNCNMGGFGSPQGVINAIRDDASYQKKIKKDGGYVYETFLHPGRTEKRLCIREGELTNILKLMSDPKIRCDEMMRNMWDGKSLQNRVAGITNDGESKSLVCKKPHGSIIGWTTRELLNTFMPIGYDQSGTGNRFLYCQFTRLQLVPRGGPEINWSMETVKGFRNSVGEEESFVVYLYEAKLAAQKDQHIPIHANARNYWDSLYLRLEAQKYRTDIVSRLTSRGPAHVRRLATILCLVDRETTIQLNHLKAAMAIWQYGCESVHFILLGCSLDQEKIIRLAQKKDPEPITSTDVYDLFGRNKPGEWCKEQIAGLVANGNLVPVRTIGRQEGSWEIKK